MFDNEVDCVSVEHIPRVINPTHKFLLKRVDKMHLAVLKIFREMLIYTEDIELCSVCWSGSENPKNTDGVTFQVSLKLTEF